MLRPPLPRRQSQTLAFLIPMHQYTRDNLRDTWLQDPLLWPSFHLDCGAESGRFARPKPANRAPFALYPILGGARADCCIPIHTRDNILSSSQACGTGLAYLSPIFLNIASWWIQMTKMTCYSHSVALALNWSQV